MWIKKIVDRVRGRTNDNHSIINNNASYPPHTDHQSVSRSTNNASSSPPSSNSINSTYATQAIAQDASIPPPPLPPSSQQTIVQDNDVSTYDKSSTAAPAASRIMSSICGYSVSSLEKDFGGLSSPSKPKGGSSVLERNHSPMKMTPNSAAVPVQKRLKIGHNDEMEMEEEVVVVPPIKRQVWKEMDAPCSKDLAKEGDSNQLHLPANINPVNMNNPQTSTTRPYKTVVDTTKVSIAATDNQVPCGCGICLGCKLLYQVSMNNMDAAAIYLKTENTEDVDGPSNTGGGGNRRAGGNSNRRAVQNNVTTHSRRGYTNSGSGNDMGNNNTTRSTAATAMDTTRAAARSTAAAAMDTTLTTNARDSGQSISTPTTPVHNTNTNIPPYTPLHDLNPSISLCMDADQFGDGESIGEFDVCELANTNDTDIDEDDYLAIAECLIMEPGSESTGTAASTSNMDRSTINNNSNDNWIPTYGNTVQDAIDHVYDGWILDRESSMRCHCSPTIGKRQCYTHEEKSRVYGPFGMLKVRDNCTIYNKKEPRFGDKLPSGMNVENLQDFSCKAKGCKVEVRIARTNGGLLLYKKLDPDTGRPYIHTFHNVRKNDKDTSCTVEQQIILLSRCRSDAIKDIAHDMIQSRDVTTFPQQEEDEVNFTKTCRNWVSNPSTIDKHFKHDYREEGFITSDTKAILDALKSQNTDEPDGTRAQDASINDFMLSPLFKTMMEQVNVLDHNFKGGDGKDMVFFETRHIAEVVKLAGKMYPNEVGDKQGAIQISCDFTYIPGTPYMLGICGVDDFAHRFWPTSFIICHTENGVMAKKIMGRMVDLINADQNGCKDKALIDGANALYSACNDLGLDPRSCFTHITRLPLTRGGGKRGSKGSFANYLIQTMKLPHKDAIPIVADALTGNFVPPQDSADFSAFMKLMWEKHEETLTTNNEKNESQKQHLRNNVLSDNPLRLGGRAAGIPGQTGSNNGGEKRGGIIKDNWRRITKKLSKNAKQSVVFIIAAVAMDLMMCPNLSKFAWKPIRTIDDYDLVRRICKHDLSTDHANLPSDIQYLIYTVRGSHTEPIDPLQAIGNENCSCTIHLPTASCVLSELRTLEVSVENSADSWLENSVVDQNSVLDSYQKSRHFLNNCMTPQKKIELKRSLLQNLKENVPGRQVGERLRGFINRRCQRNPSKNTTRRTVSRIKQKKARKVKSDKKPSELELRRERDKHGKTSGTSEDV